MEMGAVSGSPEWKRMMPSEAEQKLRFPISLETGVATAT
jgi:hypothetical protein